MLLNSENCLFLNGTIIINQEIFSLYTLLLTTISLCDGVVNRYRKYGKLNQHALMHSFQLKNAVSDSTLEILVIARKMQSYTSIVIQSVYNHYPLSLQYIK